MNPLKLGGTALVTLPSRIRNQFHVSARNGTTEGGFNWSWLNGAERFEAVFNHILKTDAAGIKIRWFQVISV